MNYGGFINYILIIQKSFDNAGYYTYTRIRFCAKSFLSIHTSTKLQENKYYDFYYYLIYNQPTHEYKMKKISYRISYYDSSNNFNH